MNNNSSPDDNTYHEYSEYVTSRKDSAGELNESLLEEYLTNPSETIVKVDEDIQQTRAEAEARQWLKDIYAKGDDYINSLLLASLHLKTYTGDGIDFLEGQHDIRSPDHFQADQVPEARGFHGVDTKSRYNSERAAVAADAYNRILSQDGGEDDLARYILYRETSLLDETRWHQKERDLVKWLALDEVKGELYTRSHIIVYQVLQRYLCILPPSTTA